MEVRELKTKDFFTVAKILSKLGNKVIQDVKENTNELQAGLMLLTAALEHAEKDMLEWLADIAGKTKEEFEDMHFDAPIDVIETLTQKEDMQRFFKRVRALLDKTSMK